MTDFPSPASDPEAEGLPDVADDDSTARDDVGTGREADGPDPAPLPGDSPAAVDRFGVTAQEQRDGEPLDFKLGRETPERPIEQTDAELAADVADPGPTSDPDSPVSLYDRDDIDLGTSSGTPVGRLVEPDEGHRSDEEADSVAQDAGSAGGGASAEELAMHETPSPPLQR
jgi:hypothetical protein